MYSENGQTKYHLNNGDCKIYIPKIYDSIVNFKKEDDVYKKEWISEGNYWLTELCEALDPQLEKLM